jgi:hypothetical protein
VRRTPPLTRFFSLLYLSLGLNGYCVAQTEKQPKEPKHFFKTTIFLDQYHRPKTALNHKDFVGAHLKNYSIDQTTLAFYTPLFTANKYNKDSTVNSNFHILFTGNYLLLQPKFEGISNHNLIKYGFGVRAIYNTGEKSIFFFESSPFVTQDASYTSESKFRMAGTLLWSYSPSDHYNFRLGATRSFLWGNRYWLPFIGLRFGAIDKFNFSIQFPRIISLNMPISNKVRTSVFTKSQGGLFQFSNRDTVYYINNTGSSANNTEKTINFGRYEFLVGARVDVAATRCWSFYLATGFSTRNYVAFYSNGFNKDNKKSYSYFYNDFPASTYFLNVGTVIRFGKTKSYYNNRNMYEAHDLNNTLDPGENNVNPGNGDIPYTKKRKKEHVKPSEIQDLIDANDF